MTIGVENGGSAVHRRAFVAYNGVMTLHLIKLCVGVAEIDQLAHWQARRWKEFGQVFHITRMMPRRADELLDGGSLYWVIKGQVLVRQRFVGIERFRDDEGVRRCRLVLDRELVATRPQPRRAFQGWRYLEARDAPRDLAQGGADGLPPEMQVELAELGLL